MFESKIIYEETMIHITCRADLRQYLLDTGRILFGTSAVIKIDRSLRNVLDAFEIPFPTGGNHQICRILKKDGVFDGVDHYTDSEYSSVNTLFHTLEGFYIFVENFSNWLEKNDKSEPRPTIEYDKEIKN